MQSRQAIYAFIEYRVLLKNVCTAAAYGNVKFYATAGIRHFRENSLPLHNEVTTPSTGWLSTFWASIKTELRGLSASELYRPSDRRLSVKLVPTFADRGCHVVSVTNSYGRNLGFLDRLHILHYLKFHFITTLI
jgi:hypothetical protein